MSNTAPTWFTSPRVSAAQEAVKAPNLVVVEGEAADPRKVAWPLVIVLVFTIVLALGLPLVMNTHMAQRAYEIRHMRVELAELKTETAVLEREVLDAASPEQLAEKASAIGLVPAASVGVISLEEGTVEGGEAAVEKK